MGTSLPIFYDCKNCPAYCCSYPRIEVTKRDLARLAKLFHISVEQVRKRYTTMFEKEVVLRHRKDEDYGSVCQFLDNETRECSVHPARPQICRDHPGKPTCAYYAFLMSERDLQRDDDQVARAYNLPGEWVPLK